MSSIITAITGGISGNKGGAGLGYQAGQANLQNPTTVDQANAQYGNAQTGLEGQQALLAALAGQNGIQNQQNVYGQLQNVAAGKGPNPAQTLLANQTGQNIAQQASLMASQRGSGANTGMIARQAAQQGGNLQQQAAGQAAALQAQQSLNALNQAGGMATNQVNQQSNATGAYTNAAQNEQGTILSGINAQNQAQNASMASQNSANAGISAVAAKQQGDLIGNIFGGIGSALQAEGGVVKQPAMYADGGTTTLNPTQGATTSPSSKIGQYFAQSSPQSTSQQPDDAIANGANQFGQALGEGMKSAYDSASNYLTSMSDASGGSTDAGSMSMGRGSAMAMNKGGPVQALVSPGEQYIPPQDIPKVKAGANPLAVGEKIPGKPKHPGNDYRNDTVPKVLEEGGLVLPNSVMQSKHPQWEAHKFVAAHLAKGGKVKKPKKGKS